MQFAPFSYGRVVHTEYLHINFIFMVQLLLNDMLFADDSGPSPIEIGQLEVSLSKYMKINQMLIDARLGLCQMSLFYFMVFL